MLYHLRTGVRLSAFPNALVIYFHVVSIEYILNYVAKELPMNTTLLECSNPACKTLFERRNSEVNRNARLNRANFCGSSCKGKMNHSHLTYRETSHLNSANRRDKYTGLRDHLRRAKRRRADTDLSLDDLLQQWELQEGKCIYTGVLMVHPVSCPKDTDMFHKASLDRVDSALGYVNGNIQFISATCNFAKHSMTHEQMLIFCRIMSDHWGQKVTTPLRPT